MLNFFSLQTFCWLFLRIRLSSDRNWVIICRSGFGGPIIGLARRHGVKVIVDHSLPHPDFLVEMGLNSRNDIFLKKLLNDITRADLVLVNSDFVKETCISAGMKTEVIKVAYLEVDPYFFSVNRDYLLERKLKLLFAGTVSKRKGVSQLHQILSSNQDLFDITIVGDWNASSIPLRKEMQSIPNVTLRPTATKDELLNYMATHDVFLFPTLAEGSARVACEAMATGMPVITTMFAGLPGVPNKHWIKLDLHKEFIHSQVLSIIRNKALLRDIGINGKDLLLKMTFEKHYESVITRLIKQL